MTKFKIDKKFVEKKNNYEYCLHVTGTDDFSAGWQVKAEVYNSGQTDTERQDQVTKMFLIGIKDDSRDQTLEVVKSGKLHEGQVEELRSWLNLNQDKL